MRFLFEVHPPHAVGYLNVLTPIVKDLQLISAITLIGLLLAIFAFIKEDHAKLSVEALRIRALALIAAAVWLVSTLGSLFIEIANLLSTSLVASFDPAVINSFISQTALGKTYAIELIAAVIVFAALTGIRKTTGAFAALVITFIGLLAPVFEGHASSLGNHGLAIGSMLFHVIFISLWVGGAIGLIAISPREREEAIPRFSALALWSVVAIALSGTANAWTRMNFASAWSTRYGAIVLLKIFLTIILIFIGYQHRKFIAAKVGVTHKVFRLLCGEVLLMITVVSLGGWLSTSEHPENPSDTGAVSAAQTITGLPMPKPPTLSRIIWAYSPDGFFLGLLILATALYIKGVLVLARRGDKWPVGRTVAFICGVGSVDFATSGGLGLYAHFAFSFHMIAHMILGMIAPIGFILSAPITLALRTLPQGRSDNERGIRGQLVALLNSRYMKVLTNPIVALAIFDGSLFLLYMTPLFGGLMQNHAGHLFMNIHFLLAGALFFHVIVGIDPNPQKVPHIVRIIILFAAMSIHAFFSIALLSATTLLDGGYFASLHRPWLSDLLVDQHTGGAVGWAMGEIPILIALVATFIQWVREDKKETKRIDRAEDRAAAMGADDELAKYNKYLAELAQRDKGIES
jgi:cytochrome c oxidase assembly factor CtaG/putative copper export protein